MQIKITGRGLKISAPLRDYVLKKTARLEDFFSNMQKAEVVLEAHSIDDALRRQMAEIRVWLAGKKIIQAKEAGKDLYAAADLALEEAKRQIIKHKEKVAREHRRAEEKTKRNLAQITF